MKWILLVLAAAICAGSCDSSSNDPDEPSGPVIRGVFVDGKDRPIEGASVYIESGRGQGQEVRTNSNGSFVMAQPVGDGPLTLLFRRTRAENRRLTVSTSGSIDLGTIRGNVPPRFNAPRNLVMEPQTSLDVEPFLDNDSRTTIKARAYAVSVNASIVSYAGQAQQDGVWIKAIDDGLSLGRDSIYVGLQRDGRSAPAIVPTGTPVPDFVMAEDDSLVIRLRDYVDAPYPRYLKGWVRGARFARIDGVYDPFQIASRQEVLTIRPFRDWNGRMSGLGLFVCAGYASTHGDCLTLGPFDLTVTPANDAPRLLGDGGFMRQVSSTAPSILPKARFFDPDGDDFEIAANCDGIEVTRVGQDLALKALGGADGEQRGCTWTASDGRAHSSGSFDVFTRTWQHSGECPLVNPGALRVVEETPIVSLDLYSLVHTPDGYDLSQVGWSFKYDGGPQPWDGVDFVDWALGEPVAGGSSRPLTINIQPNRSGVAWIWVEADLPGCGSGSMALTLVVDPVQDAPTLLQGGGQFLKGAIPVQWSIMSWAGGPRAGPGPIFGLPPGEDYDIGYDITGAGMLSALQVGGTLAEYYHGSGSLAPQDIQYVAYTVSGLRTVSETYHITYQLVEQNVTPRPIIPMPDITSDEDQPVDLIMTGLYWMDVQGDFLTYSVNQELDGHLFDFEPIPDGLRLHPPGDFAGSLVFEIFPTDGERTARSNQIKWTITPIPDPPLQVEYVPDFFVRPGARITIDGVNNGDGDPGVFVDPDADQGDRIETLEIVGLEVGTWKQDGDSVTISLNADFIGTVEDLALRAIDTSGLKTESIPFKIVVTP